MASWLAARGIPLRMTGVQWGKPWPFCQLWAINQALGQWITIVSEKRLKVGCKIEKGCSNTGQKRSSTAGISSSHSHALRRDCLVGFSLFTLTDFLGSFLEILEVVAVDNLRNFRGAFGLVNLNPQLADLLF